MRYPSFLVVVFVAFALSALGAAPPDAKVYDGQIRPFLADHCQQCHSGVKPKGDFRLDQLSTDFTNEANQRQWLKLLDRVQSGEMPPKPKTPPSEKEVATLSSWVASNVEAAAAARQAEGRVVLRRLNRVEYENTLRDLLGVPVNIREQFPQDGMADGFDNIGSALHTSSFLMERYLEAADTALNLAIVNRPQPPKLIKERYTLKESHPVRSSTEKVYRFLDDTVVCFCSSAWHNVGVSKFYPQDGGQYRVRISAYAFQSEGKPVTFRLTQGNTRLTGKTGLVGYFDAPPDKPKVFEFVLTMEPRTTISMLPYGLASSQTVHKIGAENYDGPGLAIEWVDVEGPLYASWPPESHRRIFGNLEQKPAPAYNFSTRVEAASAEPLKDAQQILREFTRRAFRCSVTDQDVQPFVEVFEAKLADGYSFESAIRAALKGILVSPDFLFLREKPGELDDFALASRLSYFLWSSMPDEELLALAEQGKLKPALQAQVERLLQDPKATAFTENFVGQWLGLRDIDFTEPSHILYPEFDHMLKVAMIRETELFFEELLRNDLSLTNFVASDFTMLNGRLAKHYGIAGVDGWEFVKHTLKPENHRGGVLTMASVLKVTSNGTTTSPVVRGARVLDRILGTPPSPPPEGVAALDPDIRGATTIREQLAKHRSVAACASCHTKIDPPGFALESFDCIGGWRDNYRVTGNGKPVVIDGRRMAYHEGKKVDPSDVLPDGTKFSNVDELKQLLLRDKDQLARALAVKLLTYSTGAAPTAVDQRQIDAIVGNVRTKNYGLRTLVHQIVQSELFRRK
jgi:mono/diheme cytochrome c family protein